MIKPYNISVPKSTLDNIYKKVKTYPWKMMQNVNGWEYGTNNNFLKKISQYWVSKYNWKKFENKINSLNESGKFTSKIVTEIEAISDFYNAEDYHQDYYKKRGIDGCAI